MPTRPLKPQQFRQTRRTTPRLQKLMLQQLRRTRPTPNIDTQTHAQKRLQLLTQPFRPLQPRRPIRRNQPQRLQRLFIQIRRLAFNHFNRHDAETPHVDFGAVFLLLDDFGGHPVGRADHGGAFGFLLGEFGAEAEVGDFDGAGGGEEDIVGFDVSVDDVLVVQVFETFACLIFVMLA